MLQRKFIWVLSFMLMTGVSSALFAEGELKSPDALGGILVRDNNTMELLPMAPTFQRLSFDLSPDFNTVCAKIAARMENIRSLSAQLAKAIRRGHKITARSVTRKLNKQLTLKNAEDDYFHKYAIASAVFVYNPNWDKRLSTYAIANAGNPFQFVKAPITRAVLSALPPGDLKDHGVEIEIRVNGQLNEEGDYEVDLNKTSQIDIKYNSEVCYELSSGKGIQGVIEKLNAAASVMSITQYMELNTGSVHTTTSTYIPSND